MYIFLATCVNFNLSGSQKRYRVKNLSDCRIRYRALLQKNKGIYLTTSVSFDDTKKYSFRLQFKHEASCLSSFFFCSIRFKVFSRNRLRRLGMIIKFRVSSKSSMRFSVFFLILILRDSGTLLERFIIAFVFVKRLTELCNISIMATVGMRNQVDSN